MGKHYDKDIQEVQGLQIDLGRWPSYKRKLAWGKVPHGYKILEEDPYTFIPDVDKIVYIEQAFDFIDQGHSLRRVCDWYMEKAATSLTHVTMSNMYKKHRKPFLHKKTDRNIQIGKKNKLSPEVREKRKAKAQINQAQKKLQELEKQKEEKEREKVGNKINPTKYSFDYVPQNVSIIFQPNEGPQTDFLASSEQEVLYGGSAGGGKSYAMLADPMRYFGNPNFVGLLLRRTNDELRELIGESQKLYPRAYPGAVWREKDKEWRFPSGARFWMTYLERDDDVLRYQGQAFTWIGVDELTQYATPYAWNYLRSRLRSVDPTLPLCMRATTNPGGPGHQWVKKMFIDPAPENTPFPATDDNGKPLVWMDDGETPEDLIGKPLFYRRFIPAKLKDNPYLMKDPNYRASLLSLPEDQRRKLLYGDWTVMEGAAFPEFRMDVHTCKPFKIPHNWRRFRACDFGYSSFSAVEWFAIDPAYGTLYLYRELYVSKHSPRDLAARVLKEEEGEGISYGILDSSCWHNRRGDTGPTIAEEMIVSGCRWRPSDRSPGSRINGRMRLHELLKVDPQTERPGIIIFDTCRQIISDLPMLPTDPHGGDDIDDKYTSDHAYDAVRYGIMSRPRAPDLTWENYTPGHQFQIQDEVFGY